MRGVLQLIVDKWEMPTGTGTGTGVPVKVSSVTIVRQQDGDIKVDGEELIIGFQQLFLRHPAPGQGDIVFAHDNLEELADCVWTASGQRLGLNCVKNCYFQRHRVTGVCFYCSYCRLTSLV